MYISIYLAAKSATLSRSTWDPCGIDTIFFFILWCGQLTETWMRKDFWKTSLIRRRILPFFLPFRPTQSLYLYLYLCGIKYGGADDADRRELKPKSGWMTMVVRRPSKALFLSPLIKVAIISTAANLYTKSIHYLEKGKPTDLGLALSLCSLKS